MHNRDQIIAKICGVFLLVAVTVSPANAADTAAPSVRITYPSDDALIEGVVTVKIDASDNVSVAQVSLKVDGALYFDPLLAAPYTSELLTQALSNGVHTLHAVATDSSGNLARSSIITVRVNNPPSYILGAGPYSIEDLGSLLSVNTQRKAIMFRDAQSGELHLVLYYFTTDATQPIQLLDLNLSTGLARLTDTIAGYPGPNGTCYHTGNNKLYMGSGAPNYLLEYDPVSGSARQISALRYRSTQYAEIGDDGWVYIGEYNNLGGGAVERYNPTTSTLEDLGIMDPAQSAPQYAYTVGADGRYVYVSLGENPWYLAVYDLQTKSKVLHWKAANDSLGAVWRLRAGGWVYSRTTSAGEVLWYDLKNGVPSLRAAVSPASECYSYNNESGNTVRDSTSLWAYRFNVTVELSQIYPNSSSNAVLIKWQPVGASEWRSASVSGFRLLPVNIKRLYPWQQDQILGWADLYGPMFLYNTVAGSSVTLGYPRVSLYDALFEHDSVYFSGYASATLAYVPSKPWTLTATAAINNSSINPYQLPADFGKYHYYSTFGADGALYIGGHHERDSTGGELGWYDRISNSASRIREPFLNDDVRDLKPVLGAKKLVYVSTTEKLFVFDVLTKQIERVITPQLGSLDKIVEVAPGIIVGVTETSIYKLDSSTGTILFTKPLGGAPFGGSSVSRPDRRLILGPDGFLWMFIGNALYRIDPTDGVLTKVLETPAKMLFFKNGDLYLYGGTSLQRVSRLLVRNPTGPSAPSSLRVTQTLQP